MRTVNTAAAVRVACKSAREHAGGLELSPRDRDQERAARADPARLGRREQAAVKAADHEHEQRKRGPDVAQRPEPLAPAAGRARRQKARPQDADGGDRQHVHRDREQARKNAGDEQLADVLLGDEAVDGEHRRGRKDGAERAAGGDHARGEGLRIVVSPHLGIGDGGEGCGGRDRRAADRGEAGAGRDRRQAQPAPPMPDEAVGRPEQFAAHAGSRDKRAHEQEHRDDAERVVGDRPHRGLPDHLQRRLEADDRGVAGHADQAHRHPDRNAEQNQREQRDEAERGRRIGTHRPALIPAPWRSDRG